MAQAAPQTGALEPPSTATPFQFPGYYSFPPFFTAQPNLVTRAAQHQKWSLLIQAYCRHNRIFVLSLIDALNSPLFHNAALNRRLSLNDAREVLNWMASEPGGNRAEWIGGTGKAKTGAEKVWVYWRRPEEWASVLEGWVDGTGQKGSVLTLWELVEGEATASQEFHGMDMDLLQKSLQVLVKRGKAQIFGQEDSLGVKFF
ncbi:ESCRT-II complex, vps25 subunit [Microthyrium microscopicum]|uniref:Vacuolar protein-sorting-associated protein 25 n=1 Tax=Microthyrium microscopicum TaxID=703497 RepID=A0A6A6U8J0_9PEZI|nr:ESCRT-II complex, vps25 subunit [Microthyrium microscopicum]